MPPMTFSACSTRPPMTSSRWTASSTGPRAGSPTGFSPDFRRQRSRSTRTASTNRPANSSPPPSGPTTPAPLWELLDRYFVSRPAEEGLLLLGDLLFERGEFRAAEQTWQATATRRRRGRRLPRFSTQTRPQSGRGSCSPSSTRRSRPRGTGVGCVSKTVSRRERPVRREDRPIRGNTAGLARQPAGDRPASERRRELAHLRRGVDRSGHISAWLSGEWPAQPTWKEQSTTVERSEAAPTGPRVGPPSVIL